ncbi:Hypothetical protein SMAX5B_019501, partial [Scophthalmus maximus]
LRLRMKFSPIKQAAAAASSPGPDVGHHTVHWIHGGVRLLPQPAGGEALQPPQSGSTATRIQLH